MLLLDTDKPLHQNFQSDNRYKVEFVEAETGKALPPLYVFIDNTNMWHIDTRLLVPALYDCIVKLFNALYEAHFEVLTDEKVLDMFDYTNGFVTLRALLVGDAAEPAIAVSYSGREDLYAIPGHQTKVTKMHKTTAVDDMLDEIRKNKR